MTSPFADLCATAGMSVRDALSYLKLAPEHETAVLAGGPIPVRARQALLVEARLNVEADTARSVPTGESLHPQLARHEDGKQSVATVVSLFTGAGGLDLGLEDAGFETVFANEIEPHACETLRQNKALRSATSAKFDKWFQSKVLAQRCYKDASRAAVDGLRTRLAARREEQAAYLEHAVIDNRDVRRLRGEEILAATQTTRGGIDLIAGGPPCQPFSRAGKREMIDCDKGQLFLEFVRLVDEVRPRWFLFENVKGLVIQKADIAFLTCSSCRTGSLADFEERASLRRDASVVRRCARCAVSTSHLVEWRSTRGGSLEVIEHEFSRIGYKVYSTVLNGADFGTPQSRERLFIVGSRDGESFSWPKPTHVGTDDSGRGQPLLFKIEQRRRPWVTAREALYLGGHWRYGDLDLAKAVLWVKNVVRPHDEPVTWTLDRVAPTIGAHQAAKLAIAPLGVPEAQLARQQWHVLGRRQGDSPPVFVEHEYLTDEELLRLQTFPPSWYLHGTRMERAFQIGNAVPPLLAKAVGEAILRAMSLNEATSTARETLNVRYA